MNIDIEKLNTLLESLRSDSDAEVEAFQNPQPVASTVYGHDRTIHRTGHLDVEMDDDNNVVSVWYRCLPLPFETAHVGCQRAHDMREMYSGNVKHKILAVEVTQ